MEDLEIKSNKIEYIPPNKHVFICGATGSGKSYLAEHYLANYDYVVKLDTKDEATERELLEQSAWDGLEEGKDFVIVRDFELLDECETNKIIYAPPLEEQDEDSLNKFFRWIFERQNTILWIDEVMGFTSGSRCPLELRRLMTQGRSKNIGVWVCSQRPSGVPMIITANSTYYFVYNLFMYEDRLRIARSTGMEEMKELPGGYNFWYYKMGDSQAVKARLVF